jgi:hypothetical protein
MKRMFAWSMPKRIRNGTIGLLSSLPRLEMDDERLNCSVQADQILALHEALERIAQERPEKAQLVKLTLFAELIIQEASHAPAISHSMASRYWTQARAWFRDALSDM